MKSTYPHHIIISTHSLWIESWPRIVWLVWEYRRLDGLVDWWWVEEEQAEKINESAAMFLG